MTKVKSWTTRAAEKLADMVSAGWRGVETFFSMLLFCALMSVPAIILVTGLAIMIPVVIFALVGFALIFLGYCLLAWVASRVA